MCCKDCLRFYMIFPSSSIIDKMVWTKILSPITFFKQETWMYTCFSSTPTSNASTVWFNDLSFTLDHEVLLLVSSSLSRQFWYLFKCLSSFIDKHEMMESWSIVKISTLSTQSMILVNPFVMPISQGVIEAHTYVGTLLRSQPYLVM